MIYENKTYLIVGGSTGIGFETAKRLAENGAIVILVSSNEEKLKRAVDELNSSRSFSICCDLSMPENVTTVFTQLRSKNIKLDGMVYCAGIAPLCLLKDNTVELMNRVFAINTLSFIESVRGFYSEDISIHGGRIVAISSITARGAGYRQMLYGASKAAMISAVKLMSKELLNRDIRINCISPSVVETGMLAQLRVESSNLDDRIKATQPLGVIPPQEVASAVVYMLGEGSEYRTGTEWLLDGGSMLK